MSDPQHGTQTSQHVSASRAASSAALYKFLMSCRVERNSAAATDTPHTHTSIAKPAGSFYVSADRYDAFVELYKKCVDDGGELHVTEKHRSISPVLIDLDFRFPGSVAPPREELYDPRDLAIKLCLGYAKRLFDYTECGPSIRFFFQQKPDGPQPLGKGGIKDGVHIIVPDIVTHPALQHVIRELVLGDLVEVLAPLGLSNRIEDVIDEAVIERNNWLMSGSKKPGSVPYETVHVIDVARADLSVSFVPPEEWPSRAESVELFSIRNKYEETPATPAKQGAVDLYVERQEEKRRRREALRSLMSDVTNIEKNVCDDFEQVCRLVDMLSTDRVERYDDWIRLGWCLRNVDHRLIEKWEGMSRKSVKYVEGECQRLWNNMRRGGLGIGSLHMWARTDSPDDYKLLIRSSVKDMIIQSASGTHYDVARVIYELYKHDYVCTSIRFKRWYEYRGHRWVEVDSAYTLRNKLSTDLVREYGIVINQLQTVASSSTGNDSVGVLELCKSLTCIQISLKKSPFKDNVIRECCELFMDESFEEDLNSDCQLVGFKNGVYDLANDEFRGGRPEDRLSFCTGVNFIEYDEGHQIMQDIKRFFHQIHPNNNVREYVLKTLSSCLSGVINTERFHIWTGSGSNGKSLTVTLMEKSFGDYCCKFPITMLTRQRAASNAANSEIARARGRRFGVLQEPSEDERLNIGLMKEMSGGDKIQCRELYKPPVEWKPQFKLFLLCNHLPTVPSNDGGTWRRIRVTNFSSKFTQNPSQSATNEFMIDPELHVKIELWREHFMSLLVHYFRTHGHSIYDEPDEVLVYTREYQRNNDHMSDFVDSYIEFNACSEKCVLLLDEAFQSLKDWIKTDNVPMRVPKKKDFQNYLDRHLKNKGAIHDGKVGYVNYTLRNCSFI